MFRKQAAGWENGSTKQTAQGDKRNVRLSAKDLIIQLRRGIHG